ncbi:hypothetical protein ACHAWF_000583 [Thalassiosira exigua]
MRDFFLYQAEIAVMDYDLSLQKPSIVATAAIFNSIEGVPKKRFPSRLRFQYFQPLSEAAGINPFSREVNEARAHLHVLF